MGIAIAEELYSRGAAVTLVLGPTSVPVKRAINTVRVQSAAEMLVAAKKFCFCRYRCNECSSGGLHASYQSNGKNKKSDEQLSVSLTKTTDILKHLVSKNKQLLVGFALETNNEKEYALNKLRTKMQILSC